MLSVEDCEYNDYYYKYVSETLYPYLLGYKDRLVDHPISYLENVTTKIAAKVQALGTEQPIILCDYHLYQLPAQLPDNVQKIFYWFIPILTIDNYKSGEPFSRTFSRT